MTKNMQKGLREVWKYQKVTKYVPYLGSLCPIVSCHMSRILISYVVAHALDLPLTSHSQKEKGAHQGL